ncbi:hypothetical protein CHUAL_012326 [Chamberlinius hualienensis]
MTGYFPFRIGMQKGVIWRHSAAGLPIHLQLLPQKLQQAGYSTHLIGKWHLGHCNQKYLPIERGFNTSLGPLAGAGTYFSHQLTGENITDFFNGTKPITNLNGTHSSIIYLQEVERVLRNHLPDQPLFLYLPFNLPHSPLEVEEKYLNLYAGYKGNPQRKIFNAMVSTLDENIAFVIDGLKKFGLYDNSFIIFSSDNGGQVIEHGNNFPLRGTKCNLYEGGVRVPGFIHSPLLKQKGFVYNGLIHAVDWFTTILNLANVTTDDRVDGLNVWESVTRNLPSPRTTLVYNIDNSNTSSITSAIRVGNWKLIDGDGTALNEIYTTDAVLSEYAPYGGEDKLPPDPKGRKTQLYHLSEDPSEMHNLADSMPEKVADMKHRLKILIGEAVPPLFLRNNKHGQSLSRKTGILNTDWCQPK